MVRVCPGGYDALRACNNEDSGHAVADIEAESFRFLVSSEAFPLLQDRLDVELAFKCLSLQRLNPESRLSDSVADKHRVVLREDCDAVAVRGRRDRKDPTTHL